MKQVHCNLENLKFAGQFRVLIGSLVIMFFFTACATGVSRVKLYEPLEYKPAKEETVKEAQASNSEIKSLNSQKIKIAINKIRDNRQDISCIGAKKNAYGMKMGKVDVEEGFIFIDLFKQHLIDSFQKAGYEIVPLRASSLTPSDNKDDVRAIVDAEVRSFWVEFMPGFFVVDAESDVNFEVRLKDIGNKEIWDETFIGKGKVSSGLGITRSMFEESINMAYSEAMKTFYKTISDDNVRKLLVK